MALHLIKLCVGCDTAEELAAWQRERLRQLARERKPVELCHRTFQSPKRREELLAGGSIYWVIKGVVQARQRLLDIREGTKDDGTPCALLVLDPALVPVRPARRRPFQGWRYLSEADAPADLSGGRADDVAEMPPRLRRELAELGLI